jgi:hypothetical protein
MQTLHFYEVGTEYLSIIWIIHGKYPTLNISHNSEHSLSQIFLLAGPFWLRNITTHPHILADVNGVSE